MKTMNKTRLLVLLSIIFLVLSACRPDIAVQNEATQPTPVVREGGSTHQKAAMQPSPEPEPTPTPEPIKVRALLWEENPQIPIINFHGFTPRRYDEETGTVMYLWNFQSIIKRLYDAGYSLISIRDYLDGRIVVPEGRKPLVLSVDDAYFANQLALNEEGMPSKLSGIGWLYYFAQENPDFGYEVAMFANFGDKLYGNMFLYDWWYLGDNWEIDFAKTIVWGMEHNVVPYNHLYQHPDLEKISELEIHPQIEKNDSTLRYFLKLADREDLIEHLPNAIALPYGKWPKQQSGKDILLSYVNQEGKALEAVFEAGYEYEPGMSLSPLDENFDPYHIPRMAPINKIVRFIVDSAPKVPSAKSCELTLPHDADQNDLNTLQTAIQEAVQNQVCSNGFYIIEKHIFKAHDGVVQLWQKPLNQTKAEN